MISAQNHVSEKRESHCRFPGILKFPISGEHNYRLQASHVEAFEVLVSLEVQPVQIVEFGYDHGIFDVIDTVVNMMKPRGLPLNYTLSHILK